MSLEKWTDDEYKVILAEFLGTKVFPTSLGYEYRVVNIRDFAEPVDGLIFGYPSKIKTWGQNVWGIRQIKGNQWQDDHFGWRDIDESLTYGQFMVKVYPGNSSNEGEQL